MFSGHPYLDNSKLELKVLTYFVHQLDIKMQEILEMISMDSNGCESELTKYDVTNTENSFPL